MTGEIEFFRKRFVGGFNRQDVVNYISKLAQERNDYREAKEKADQDIHALNDYIAALRVEVDAAKREAREGREYKVAALDSAMNTFTALEAAFEHLCGRLETATQSVYAELDIARDTVAALPAILAQAGDGIRELHATCGAEKDAFVGDEATADFGAGIDPYADSGPGVGIDPYADSGPGVGIDPYADSGPGAGIDPYADADSGAGIDPYADAVSGAGIDPYGDPGPASPESANYDHSNGGGGEE